MAIAFEDFKLDSPFSNPKIAFGNGSRLQLEVVFAEYDREPAPTQLRSAWKSRQDRRGVPLLLVVKHNNAAHVCGFTGDDPTVYPSLELGQVERISEEALEQPSRQAAIRSLRDSLSALEQDGLPGLHNEGLLANRELTYGVPQRSDWKKATQKGTKALSSTGKDLLTALGFKTEPLDKVTDILKVGNRKSGIALLLTEEESPESGSDRIPGTSSPVSYALNRAEEESLDWVVILHGRKIRLYPVKIGVGVGRKGRTETFVECHTGLLPDEQAAYLWLLFSADALKEGGTLSAILETSADFAGNLASKLRERIYDEVIPRLAEGIAKARKLKKPTAQDLQDTYQMAMRILFRLLFVAYGEDKDLLPYRFNGLYQKRSLKTKARDLQELAESDQTFGNGDSWWQEVRAIFHAVDKGNPSWGVPAYNGGLFSTNSDESKIGAALEKISLPDSVFVPVLQNLLLVPTDEGVMGPVDFRSLGVREFGTIYEGLLESELSVAEDDLAVQTTGKNKDTYRPAQDNETPEVKKGKIYLHNASGARKSTGSYYTKHFAVEHLLDKSLEPAIDDHFERLDSLDEVDAAESLFDFRVADIAMGSAHFLVAAIDRIEARFSAYLLNRPLSHVAQELDHLRASAIKRLGDAAESYPDLEDNALLRRLIAKRCIYGVDINEVAVQLARLGVWIHTFVPGLPLSLLDRNLVHGNSLVGVGVLPEISENYQLATSADQNVHSLFSVQADDFVGDATDALSRLGRLTDASREEIQKARKAWQDADKATEPARALCDILTASRIAGEQIPFDPTYWSDHKDEIYESKEHREALKSLSGMNVLHFPVAFPEVFLRERSGFDVILGNPPWEKARVEEHGFWARFVPGLRGLNQRKREAEIRDLRDSRPDLLRELEAEICEASALRQALSRGPFPGMGTGDPDLYKAFCWRFWYLAGEDKGRIGVVLPRSALAAKGSEEFRWKVFAEAKEFDATLILNNRNWFFEDVHPQYTVALVGITRSSESRLDSNVYLEGPYNSRVAYDSRMNCGGAIFTGKEVLAWNDSASLPLLPTAESFDVFAQLRKAPRLDLLEDEQESVRPIAELHATNDKHLYDLVSASCPTGFWPVYKGASFDTWQPDTGEYYAWADPKVVAAFLQEKRARGHRNTSSAFNNCDTDWCMNPATLPCRFPRIAFRDVTRATDSRTMRCALVPPGVFLNHKAPYFVTVNGDHADEAFLLGILSSLPLDWFARRFVETGMTFFILNPFPIPRSEQNNQCRKRVIKLAGRLACPDDRFTDWAKEVGVKCGPLKEDEKQDMIHELDAVVAHLYGLKKDHLIHIFETFHVGWDFQERLDATLKHFDAWKGKV